jgi:hypothetical protein
MQRAVFEPFAAVCQQVAANSSSSSSGWRSMCAAFPGGGSAAAPTPSSSVMQRVQLSSPAPKLGASGSKAADEAGHPSVLLSWHPTGEKLSCLSLQHGRSYGAALW